MAIFETITDKILNYRALLPIFLQFFQRVLNLTLWFGKIVIFIYKTDFRLYLRFWPNRIIYDNYQFDQYFFVTFYFSYFYRYFNCNIPFLKKKNYSYSSNKKIQISSFLNFYLFFITINGFLIFESSTEFEQILIKFAFDFPPIPLGLSFLAICLLFIRHLTFLWWFPYFKERNAMLPFRFVVGLRK